MSYQQRVADDFAYMRLIELMRRIERADPQVKGYAELEELRAGVPKDQWAVSAGLAEHNPNSIQRAFQRLGLETRMEPVPGDPSRWRPVFGRGRMHYEPGGR